MPRTKKEHIISKDEKQAADLQIKEMQKQIDYDTRDFTIELLITKFEKKDFFIPPYQRDFVWQPKNKTLFLESVFLGLPIPFMFFADCDNGKQEVIDGAQRMQTLVEFYNNQLQLSGLKKLTKLNGFYFKDLSDTQQRKFLNKALRIIILEEDTPTAARQDLFYRINTTEIQRRQPMNNKHVKQYIIQNISHIEDSLFLRQIYTLVKLYLERKDRKHTGKAA